MRDKTTLLKKIISAAFVGTFIVTPIMMKSPAVLAAPVLTHNKNTRDQSSGNNITHERVEILQKKTRNNRNQEESFTGIITKVISDQRFDIRINGKIFNVKTANRLSRYLKRGDKVRITGRRLGANDINNAKVAKLSNR